MISLTFTRLPRTLRRRMLAIAAATVSGLILLTPGVAAADSSSPASATPVVASAAPSPDSSSWSTVLAPGFLIQSVGESPDSASWS